MTKTTLAVFTVVLVSNAAYAQQVPPVSPPSGGAPFPAPNPVQPGAPAPINREAPLETGPVPVKGKWNPTLYGFAEFDGIYDTTESLLDLAGNGVIAKSGVYAGDHSRVQFGVRNSRFGFRLTAPVVDEIKPTALLEFDLLGSQPAIAPGASPAYTEAGYFTSAVLRVRHFALKLETPVVDILAGQYWQLFGWQTYFHPNTVEIQGVPGQIFSRSPQFRLSHTFKSEDVNFEIAAAASRPPQRDAALPDGQAGARVLVNNWKGLHTMGGAGTAIDSAGLGVSGVLRHFRVPEYVSNPTRSNGKNGWGVSVDALVPIVPASDKDRANALTLTGSFVAGSGIADLYTGLTGGVTFNRPPANWTQNVDNGLVTYDTQSALHTIDWLSVLVGLQYYLPPSGHLWIAGNYSHMESGNIGDFGLNPASVIKKTDWADGNIFWDVTEPVRFGVEYAYFHQSFVDGSDSTNHRVQLSGWYIF